MSIETTLSNTARPDSEELTALISEAIGEVFISVSIKGDEITLTFADNATSEQIKKAQEIADGQAVLDRWVLG